MTVEAGAFAFVAVAIGLIACGGALLALQALRLACGEIGLNPALALLHGVAGGAAIVLGVELIIMVMR